MITLHLDEFTSFWKLFFLYRSFLFWWDTGGSEFGPVQLLSYQTFGGVKFSQAAAAPADGEPCETAQEPAGAANRWGVRGCVWVLVCVDPWLHNYRPLSRDHQECCWWPKQWPHQWHHGRWGSASARRLNRKLWLSTCGSTSAWVARLLCVGSVLYVCVCERIFKLSVRSCAAAALCHRCKKRVLEMLRMCKVSVFWFFVLPLRSSGISIVGAQELRHPVVSTHARCHVIILWKLLQSYKCVLSCIPHSLHHVSPLQALRPVNLN